MPNFFPGDYAGPVVRRYVSPDPLNPFADGGKAELAVVALDTTAKKDNAAEISRAYNLEELAMQLSALEMAGPAAETIEALHLAKANNDPNLITFNQKSVSMRNANSMLFEVIENKTPIEQFPPLSVIDAYLMSKNGLLGAQDQQKIPALFGQQWEAYAQEEIAVRKPIIATIIEADQQTKSNIEEMMKHPVRSISKSLGVFAFSKLTGIKTATDKIHQAGFDAKKELAVKDASLSSKGLRVKPYANNTWAAAY